MSVNIYGVGVINEQDLLIENFAKLPIDGLYKYKTRGSSGDIYVHTSGNIAVKVNHQPQKEEIDKQMKVQRYSPKILYHKYPYTIRMKDTGEIPDRYDNIGVIVMEYLNEDTWQPFHMKPNDKQLQVLFDVLYDIVKNYKLKNTYDIVGHSGPHIFITKSEPYKIKIIDYDNFEKCKGIKSDFLEMIHTISDRLNNNRILFLGAEYAIHHFKSEKKTKKHKILNKKIGKKKIDKKKFKSKSKSKKKLKSKSKSKIKSKSKLKKKKSKKK